MNIIRRTFDIDAETDARLREMAIERGQDVAAVLAEAVALLDSVVDIAGPDLAEDAIRRSAG
jgi:transcription termination factor Rho